MSAFEESLSAGDLRGACAREGDRVVMTFRGTADAQADAALEGFLGRVHAAIEREPAREAVVDLRDLEFMNSSCFKAFVTWIVAVRRLPLGSQYSIRFLSTSRHHWQKRSLHAISYFGGSLIQIDVE